CAVIGSQVPPSALVAPSLVVPESVVAPPSPPGEALHVPVVASATPTFTGAESSSFLLSGTFTVIGGRSIDLLKSGGVSRTIAALRTIVPDVTVAPASVAWPPLTVTHEPWKDDVICVPFAIVSDRCPGTVPSGMSGSFVSGTGAFTLTGSPSSNSP